MENRNVDEMTNFQKIIEIAKKVKLDWVRGTKRGDMPPTLFVERNGKCVALVQAPQVDKYAGLHAAKLCRIGFKADAITMMLDAHIREEITPEGMSPEEAKEHFAKSYKPGEMQRMCDEEGACEKGIISDVLLCHRVEESGKISIWTMPYYYHGQDGPPFKWLDEHKFANVTMEDSNVEGFIPDSLRQIMTEPALLDRDDELIQKLKQQAAEWEYSDEQQLYYTGRAVLRFLNEQEFLVMDLQEPPKGVTPEPIMPLQKTVSLAELIPYEVGAQVVMLMKERGREPSFKDELLALLKPHEGKIRENAENHGLPPLEIVVEDIAAKIAEGMQTIHKEMGRKPEAGTPFRVKVWSGDQKEYFGEGDYVGEVQVYVVAMPDGSIQSLVNAEERPTEEAVAEIGGKLIELGENPKIVLDNKLPDGRKVVYGCQVWWAPVDDEGCGCDH